MGAAEPRDAFALLLLVIEALVLVGPAMRRTVCYQSPQRGHAVMAAVLHASAAILLSWLPDGGVALAVAYILFGAAVALGAPATLLLMQRSKQRISGPWDEASAMCCISAAKGDQQ